MRAFISVAFSTQLKSKIAGLQTELKPYAVSGRWKYIENFHLTMKFLGEIDEKQVSLMEQVLTEVCVDKTCFDLRISEIGNFPGRDCLRVLWLGFGGDLNVLGKLHQEIDDRFSGIGFLKEKRLYHPHVTIAQDIVFDKSFDEIRKKADLHEFPVIHVDRIFLFKSEQIGARRVYTPVSEFLFGEKGENR